MSRAGDSQRLQLVMPGDSVLDIVTRPQKVYFVAGELDLFGEMPAKMGKIQDLSWLQRILSVIN